MTVDEADQFYDLLEDLVTITDGSLGMPLKEEVPPPVDYRQRVLVRKEGVGNYEIFYYVIGCGVTYHWIELKRFGPDWRVFDIDKWRENNPS